MISATISRAGSSFGNLLNPGQSARNAARGWNAITGRLERSLKCYYSIRSVLGVSPDKRRNPVLTKELISLRTMCSITALTENTSSFRNLNLSSGADLCCRLSFFSSFFYFYFYFFSFVTEYHAGTYTSAWWWLQDIKENLSRGVSSRFVVSYPPLSDTLRRTGTAWKRLVISNAVNFMRGLALAVVSTNVKKETNITKKYISDNVKL